MEDNPKRRELGNPLSKNNVVGGKGQPVDKTKPIIIEDLPITESIIISDKELNKRRKQRSDNLGEPVGEYKNGNSTLILDELNNYEDQEQSDNPGEPVGEYKNGNARPVSDELNNYENQERYDNRSEPFVNSQDWDSTFISDELNNSKDKHVVQNPATDWSQEIAENFKQIWGQKRRKDELSRQENENAKPEGPVSRDLSLDDISWNNEDLKNDTDLDRTDIENDVKAINKVLQGQNKEDKPEIKSNWRKALEWLDRGLGLVVGGALTFVSFGFLYKEWKMMSMEGLFNTIAAFVGNAEDKNRFVLQYLAPGGPELLQAMREAGVVNYKIYGAGYTEPLRSDEWRYESKMGWVRPDLVLVFDNDSDARKIGAAMEKLNDGFHDDKWIRIKSGEPKPELLQAIQDAGVASPKVRTAYHESPLKDNEILLPDRNPWLVPVIFEFKSASDAKMVFDKVNGFNVDKDDDKKISIRWNKQTTKAPEIAPVKGKENKEEQAERNTSVNAQSSNQELPGIGGTGVVEGKVEQGDKSNSVASVSMNDIRKNFAGVEADQTLNNPDQARKPYLSEAAKKSGYRGP